MKNLIKITAAVSLCLFLAGCGASPQALISKNLANNIDKLSSTVNSVETIKNDDIIIAAIAPESLTAEQSNVRRISTKETISRGNTTFESNNNFIYDNIVSSYLPRYQNIDNFSNENLQTHMQNLANIYAISTDILTANNNSCNIKNQIIECCTQIKELCKQIKSSKIKLDMGQLNAINDLIANVNLTTNRINMTRTETNNEVNSVKNSLPLYYKNTDELNGKYTRLLNCLDTRNSYYNNALATICQIKNIITKNGDYLKATQINQQSPKAKNEQQSQTPEIKESKQPYEIKKAIQNLKERSQQNANNPETLESKSQKSNIDYYRFPTFKRINTDTYR
ncbi:MAG: hypothetical protein RR400_01480 [Clostridia bacterium]